MFANRWITLCLLIFSISSVNAQRDSFNLRVGLNLVYYLPFDEPAVFYNGQDANRLNTILNNPVTRDQIEESLGGNTFQLVDYASDMRYVNAFAFRLDVQYRFNPRWQIDLQFLQANVEAQGNYTLLVDRRNTNNQTNEPSIEPAQISGRERRSHIQLGGSYLHWWSENFHSDLGAGLDFNFVEVDRNVTTISDQNYSLPLFSNSFNQQQQEITTSNTGFYLKLENAYELGSGYGVGLGGSIIFTSINVNEAVEASGAIGLINLSFTKAW